jgi:hypothetical protein
MGYLLLFALFYKCSLANKVPHSDRRVFMWMWGSPQQLLLDATIAAAHNESITDVVLECAFGIKPPFDSRWGNASECKQPALVLRKAGIRVWLTLEPTGSMTNVSEPLHDLWANASTILPALKSTAAELGAVGWNFDFECDGTPSDFALYLKFLSSVRVGMDGLGVLIDANGDPCTKNYTAMAEHGLVLDIHVSLLRGVAFGLEVGSARMFGPWLDKRLRWVV